MSGSLESFIALRYLKGAEGKSEGRRFLKLVTYISVGGVAVGVAALILALAIVRGFSGGITEKIVGFGAHVQVQSLRDAPLDGVDALVDHLQAQDDVEGVARVAQEFVLFRRGRTSIEGVSLTGTDPFPAFISDRLTRGHAVLDSTASGKPGVVVGAALARTLSLVPGDVVTAFSVRGSMAMERFQSPRVKQFEVVGVYETSLADFDELYVYTDVAPAIDLFSYDDDQATRLDVTLADGVEWRMAADRLDTTLDFPAMAVPVDEVYAPMFAWIELQESIIPILISIIIFVAAVNIIGTLLMIILEKTHEIGVMAGMGASRKLLVRIFLRLGLYIGIAGVVIGEVTALLLALAQQRFGFIPLPAEAYYMSEAPIDLGGVDFIVVAVLTLLLCTASAWIPARYAARVEPMKAIHLR